MIINRITINNFFRYYGKQDINCRVDKEKNVVVLIGKNGRGKTTIINAFQWTFYGKVSSPLTVDKMLNYNRLKEMPVNENEEAYVEIEFIENNETYIMKRSVNFLKNINEIAVKKGIPIVKLSKVKSDGNLQEINISNKYVNNIIPESLSGFFFFDGERIDRLAKVDGKKEIRQAILDTLGITAIENSIKDLESARKIIIKEISKYNEGGNESGLEKEHSELEIILKKREKELADCNKNIKEKKEIINECSEKLKSSGLSEINRLESDRHRLESKLKINKNYILDINKKIGLHISRNIRYYLISKKYSSVEKLLESKRQKGQLPSNIKITFINDILQREECICGCSLKDNIKAVNKIESLKANAGRNELDEAYTKIKGLIDNSKNNDGKNFLGIIDDYLKERSLKYTKIEELKKELEEVKKQLNTIGEKVEEIKKSEEIREKAESELSIYIKESGRIEGEITRLQSELNKVEKKIIRFEQNRSISRNKLNQIEVIKHLQNLNNEFKELFIKKVREDLDYRIKNIFSNITNKSYRVPYLTEDFDLKILNKLNNNSKEEVLSTGEGQIMSLSFIAALVSYAKNNKNSGIASTFLGDDYPIVMDSPFGNLDENHTENVAKNIGNLASQVIIIVSQKQWNGHVENNIKNQVIRKYIMNDGEILNNSNQEYTYIVEERS